MRFGSHLNAPICFVDPCGSQKLGAGIFPGLVWWSLFFRRGSQELVAWPGDDWLGSGAADQWLLSLPAEADAGTRGRAPVGTWGQRWRPKWEPTLRSLLGVDSPNVGDVHVGDSPGQPQPALIKSLGMCSTPQHWIVQVQWDWHRKMLGLKWLLPVFVPSFSQGTTLLRSVPIKSFSILTAHVPESCTQLRHQQLRTVVSVERSCNVGRFWTVGVPVGGFNYLLFSICSSHAWDGYLYMVCICV